MNKFLLLSLLVLAISLTSCNKCDPSNSTEGIIVEDAIVRVSTNNNSENFITDPTNYNGNIEMSLDGGFNYKTVDFSKYSVFSLTTSASCSSGYNKSVTLDKKESTVNYTINITECATCKNTSTIPNWVLTTAVPSDYTPVFSIKRE